MRKSLRQVLSYLPAARVIGDVGGEMEEWPITALRYDSRLASEDSLFFCLRGKTADGHRYAPSAYRNGCRVFVTEEELNLPADAVQILVTDTRIVLADLSADFYDHPERAMRLVGLTGTKGKTTTALLIRSILEGVGIPTGYIGTNGVMYRDYRFKTTNSTPESVEIYRYLRDMLDEGVAVCVLEISSQGLWMGRVRGLRFDTVLFTNLFRDHIGGVEHPDFEHYRACKRMLFTDYPAEMAVVNHDDAASAYMVADIVPPVVRFGVSAPNADPATDKPLWLASDIRHARRDGRIGVDYVCLRDGIPVGGRWFLPLPGDFNVQNAIAAVTVVCERFGVDPLQAQKHLATAVIAGRFETICHPALPETVFVIDYAHNGVSLAAILDALRAYHPARLICLFGSVGGRTRERRRDLAEAAAFRADLCILTSDNPADEPPDAIIAEIDRAFPDGACPRLCIPDRAEAIEKAVELARAGDIILLAGKGHETYQLVGTRALPFSEMEILWDALEARFGATAEY